MYPWHDKIRTLPQVVEVYGAIGKMLKTYTAGKLPKAFKIIPSLTNWEQVTLCSVRLLMQAEPGKLRGHGARVGHRNLPVVLQRPTFKADPLHDRSAAERIRFSTDSIRNR